MICLDNSDWMRNGDYVPTRMEAQKDAAGLICNDRTGSNPENTVGLLTMAGESDLLVSPTEESGKFLAAFSKIPIGGSSDLSTALQIAQLALKHRKNKNGGARIIAFVGGPLVDTTAQLIKIGKLLKKNEVGVDLISMGEIEENAEKLEAFIAQCNKNDNSHLITIPQGVSPANAVMSSPIMHMAGAATGSSSMGGGGGGGDANFDMYGGVDPEADPDLAMAIRASTEEARAREEARTKEAMSNSSMDVSGTGEGVTPAPASSSSSSSSAEQPSSPVPFGGFGNGFDEEDEEALMQRALEMSMKQMMTGQDGSAVEGEEMGEMDEEEELRLALAMSSAAADAPPPPPTPATAAIDSDFVSQLLGSVDQSDPLVAAALAQLSAADGGEEKKEEEKKEGGSNKRKGEDM